jgi:hypothetical protein
MRSKAAVSSTVRQFLILKIYDTDPNLAYHDVNGKVGHLFLHLSKEVVLTKSHRMEARCLRVRCTRLATMLIPLPTRVVKRSQMEKWNTSPIAPVGANIE